jgi:DNA end-binding protein Ku
MLGTKARKATVLVNGRSVDVEVSKDGSEFRVPVGGGRFVSVPATRSGSYTATLGAGGTRVVEKADVPDEDEQVAIKARAVREAAARGPVPKDARPSIRRLATIVARREHDQHTRLAALSEFRKLPLADRLTEADMPELLERVLGHVLGSDELRTQFVTLCAMVDGQPVGEPVAEPSVLDRIPTWNQDADEDLFAEPATPAEPAPVAPCWDVPISELISDLDAEVGSHEAASVVTDPEPVVAAQRAVQPVVSEPVAPRCLWVGTINAGMMSTPVRLYAAHTDRHGVELHQAHDKCGSRLSQRMLCKECGRVVDASEVGKCTAEGQQVSRAQYLALAAEAIRAIDITDFVPAADIDLTVLAEATYTVGADKNGSKALGLMHAALRAEGRIGIGRVVLRSVERLVALCVLDGQLRVSLLRWADQLKPAVEVPTVDISESELDQARALIASMSSKWNHEAYSDPRETALAELLTG